MATILAMHRSRKVNLFALLVVVSASAASCAMGNSDRRRLLNYLDANGTPQSTAGRWLAAPVALPVGIVAGATDAIVLHPLSQIDDAWVDTADVLWDFGPSTDFHAVLLTPLSAVATPVIFGVTWLWRSVFDISDSLTPSAPGAEDPRQPDDPAREANK